MLLESYTKEIFRAECNPGFSVRLSRKEDLGLNQNKFR